MPVLYAEYDEFSGFYDDFGETYTEDIGLISAEAKRTGGRKILELCCGTGRCCLSLARLGYEVVGIDLSPKMIEVAEQKRKMLWKESKARPSLTFREGNVESFNLRAKDFDMVFSTWSSLQHLDMEGRRKCYGRVFAHLRNGGVFFNDEAIRPVQDLKRTEPFWYPPRPMFIRDGQVFFQYISDGFDEKRGIQKRCVHQVSYFVKDLLGKDVKLPLDKHSSITFPATPASNKKIHMELFQPDMKDNEKLLRDAGFSSVEDRCRESHGGAAKTRFTILALKK